MQYIVADHERRQYDEDQDQGVEHQYGARILEIILSEQRDVDGKAGDHDQHIEHLSKNDQADTLLVLITPVCLFLIRHENVVCVFIHDVATIDNLLTSLNNAACQGDTVVELIQTGFATGSVVDQVGRDVVIEIAFL